MDIMDPRRIELRVPTKQGLVCGTLISIAGGVAIGGTFVVIAGYYLPPVLSLLLALAAFPVILAWFMYRARLDWRRSPLWWVLVGEGRDWTAFAPSGEVAGTTAGGTLILTLAHYYARIPQTLGLRAAILVGVGGRWLALGNLAVASPIKGGRLLVHPSCDVDKDEFERLLPMAEATEAASVR